MNLVSELVTKLSREKLKLNLFRNAQKCINVLIIMFIILKPQCLLNKHFLLIILYEWIFNILAVYCVLIFCNFIDEEYNVPENLKTFFSGNCPLVYHQIKIHLPSEFNSRRFPFYLLMTLLLYFLITFYLTWLTSYPNQIKY